jgi:hypothetical protein
MSIREAINRKPVVAAVATCAVVLAILLVALGQMRSSGFTASSVSRMYFSDDDGKTFFADDASNVAPFDHNGKQAVVAVVYRCGGEPFVGYLMKYSLDAKASLDQFSPSDRLTNPVALNIRAHAGEVKKPGGSRWVPLDADGPNTGLDAILSVTAPPGSSGDPQPVLP